MGEQKNPAYKRRKTENIISHKRTQRSQSSFSVLSAPFRGYSSSVDATGRKPSTDCTDSADFPDRWMRILGKQEPKSQPQGSQRKTQRSQRKTADDNAKLKTLPLVGAPSSAEGAKAVEPTDPGREPLDMRLCPERRWTSPSSLLPPRAPLAPCSG